jgi:hypothetical protein
MNNAQLFRQTWPRNKIEMQAAVDAANFCLFLDTARYWGLLNNRGAVNKARCEEILSRGKALQIGPRTPGPAAHR